MNSSSSQHQHHHNDDDKLDGSHSTYPFSLVEDDMSAEGVVVLEAQPRPENFSQWSQLRSGRFVMSSTVKRIFLTFIFINTMLLGASTLERVQNNDVVNMTVEYCINVFRIIFTFEVALYVAHYQRDVIHHGWVMFDCVLIVVSYAISPMLLILRAFRLLRALRKASGLEEVTLLVQALLKAIPKILALMFLFLVLFYIFSVLFTDLFRGMDNLDDNYFDRLDLTAFTLLTIMTLDNWSDVTRQLMLTYSWAWLPILSFIVVSTFLFASMGIAIVCEAVQSVAQERMSKTWEVRESHSTTHDPTVLNHLLSSAAAAQGGNTERLERKMDQLAAQVQELLLVVNRQASLLQQQQQHTQLQLQPQQQTQLQPQLVSTKVDTVPDANGSDEAKTD
jgi:voltage-gated sodium channel